MVIQIVHGLAHEEALYSIDFDANGQKWSWHHGTLHTCFHGLGSKS